MASIKFLSDLDIHGNVDLNDHELQNFKIQHLAADPSGVEGQIYYNTGSNILKYYDGSAWVSLSSATGDITEVIGGNNIDVSGGSSGAATVNLDSSTISAIVLTQLKLVLQDHKQVQLLQIQQKLELQLHRLML